LKWEVGSKFDVTRAASLLASHLLLLASFAPPAFAQQPPPPADAITASIAREGTDVTGAFADSIKLLMIEHGSRVAFQEKTRRELGGGLWDDYRRSVRVPGQWEDGDAWWVNYLGHPIHGAAAGYIWLDHEPGAPAGVSLDRAYWASRGRAFAWAAVYSLQFEFGPLSEASIGNVGITPGTSGWVDHVVTPVGAFGLIVAEDALDQFFVRWVESRTSNRFFRAALRLALNPGRTLSNTSSGRVPWHRDDRPLGWR
jgi:hypothetical protein